MGRAEGPERKAGLEPGPVIDKSRYKDEARMSLAEFTGEAPSVYTRLMEYRKLLRECSTLGTARKEFERIFKPEERV
jgi:hypothetical protein